VTTEKTQAPPIAPDFTAPFVRAVEETFEKMLSCAVSFVGRRASPLNRDISAVVGFAGAKHGVAILSFSESTACRVVSRFGGDFQEEINATVCDGIAEILNIVAGRAKGALAAQSGPIDMSLPTVVSGHDYELHRHRDSPQVILPFSSELGEFDVVVFLEKEPGGPLRILVVDDSRVMRKLVRAALKEVAPQQDVVEAENLARAREAVAAARCAFDLILLDLHMPDGNGITVLEELRQDPRGAQVPVVVITSDPDAQSIVATACDRVGGVAVTRTLQKPFAPAELVRIAQSFAR
jgi:chemotaxis protein CheX